MGGFAQRAEVEEASFVRLTLSKKEKAGPSPPARPPARPVVPACGHVVRVGLRAPRAPVAPDGMADGLRWIA